jgi:hypothetical protein
MTDKEPQQINLSNNEIKQNSLFYILVDKYISCENKNDFIDILIKLSYTDIQSDNMEYNYMNEKIVELLPMDELNEMSYEEFMNFKIQTLNDFLAQNK